MLLRRQLQIEPSQEWVVTLEPASNGGTLKLDLGRPLGDAFEGRSFPFVLLDGTVEINLGLLRRWASINGVQPTESAVVVPAMPAGGYAMCRNMPQPVNKKGDNSPPVRECVSGFLSPGGELLLELGSGGE
ncbi:MAG: hypothetical protein HC897_06785 [Thermoanaerobaculia bacterium]|nr:hypothetical protein [Thermoanaerobaculia bacterium]